MAVIAGRSHVQDLRRQRRTDLRAVAGQAAEIPQAVAAVDAHGLIHQVTVGRSSHGNRAGRGTGRIHRVAGDALLPDIAPVAGRCHYQGPEAGGVFDSLRTHVADRVAAHCDAFIQGTEEGRVALAEGERDDIHMIVHRIRQGLNPCRTVSVLVDAGGAEYLVVTEKRLGRHAGDSRQGAGILHAGCNHGDGGAMPLPVARR